MDLQGQCFVGIHSSGELVNATHPTLGIRVALVASLLHLSGSKHVKHINVVRSDQQAAC